MNKQELINEIFAKTCPEHERGSKLIRLARNNMATLDEGLLKFILMGG